MHRTTSRVGNLVVYGGLGFAKGLTKTKSLEELLEDFTEGEGSHKKTIFKSGDKHPLRNNLNLLALNINSFMGGVTNIWSDAKSTKHIDKSDLKPPSHSDGIL